MSRINLAIFASTNGTDMPAVFEAKKNGKFDDVEIKFVLSNKENCGAVLKAKEAGVKIIFIDPKGKTREEYDAECLKACQENKIDLILLIGYMRIVTPVLIDAYPGKILNIHPSLLPKYPGMDLDVHAEVIKNQETVSGCTLHIVTEELDGGPIVIQEKVEVESGETPESLKAKVQKKEQEVIVRILKELSKK